MQFPLKNGVFAVFDEQVLPYLKEKDQEVLQIASCVVDDPSRYLKELSPELKDCLLAIGGKESELTTLHSTWCVGECAAAPGSCTPSSPSGGQQAHSPAAAAYTSGSGHEDLGMPRHLPEGGGCPRMIGRVRVQRNR